MKKIAASALLLAMLSVPASLFAQEEDGDRIKDVRNPGDADCPIICIYYPCCAPAEDQVE